MKKIVIFFLGLSGFTFSFFPESYSQERLMQVKVTVFEAIPVVNALIKVKSSGITFSTDSLGVFSVPCNFNDKLSIVAKGFLSSGNTITQQTNDLTVNLTLKSGKSNSNLAIAAGHILQKEKFLAAVEIQKQLNISSGNSYQVDFTKFSSLEEAISGRYAGVSVNNGEVEIRGKETFGSSNAALVVLDGRVYGYSISGIPADTVSSIEFLKGPDAVSWGSRGANGVVIITTKRGND